MTCTLTLSDIAPCDARDSLDPTLWRPSLVLLFIFSRLPVGLSVLRFPGPFPRLPVGEAPLVVAVVVTWPAALPRDPVGLCELLVLLIDSEARRGFSKFSDLIFLLSADWLSDPLGTLPTSFTVLRSPNFTSSESDDFWRWISDGLIFRSKELDGLSESALFLAVTGAVPGTVGGSTGAARRINFGGGLKGIPTERESLQLMKSSLTQNTSQEAKYCILVLFFKIYKRL